MRYIVLCFTLLLFLVTDAIAQEETAGILIHVSPVQQDCTGEAEMTCLVIRELPDGELTLFYGTIEGFEYEAGYEYQLLVNPVSDENAPADAPALNYELIEVQAKFPASFENKVWELQSIGETVPENASEFTLLFNEDGTVAITSDCNSFMLSEYTLNPAFITLSGMTMMFCEGSAEGEYVAALNTINLWTIENGELFMVTDAGNLRFAPPSIDGKNWRVQSYESVGLSWQDDGTVDYTMNFDGETVALQIACNGGSGTVMREGARIKLDAVVSTLMGCPEEPLLGIFPPMDFIYSIDSEGRLILQTADGRFTLVEVAI
jgi:heat shock protein HslJ